MATDNRTTADVRRDIAGERDQLADAVEDLRAGLGEAADVAGKLRARLPIVAVGALGAGVVVAGGVGATMRVLAEGKDPKATKVGEIASRDLVTVSPDEDLDQALKLLAQHQVRRLPVVEGDRVVGIVAQADVARLGKDAKTGEVVEEISR